VRHPAHRAPRGRRSPESRFLAYCRPVWLAAAAACTGPALHLECADPLFVDGVREPRDEVPFRYYGTTRLSAQPMRSMPGDDPRPDWDRQPSALDVAIPPPITGWLFPLDLPLELLRRGLFGREDARAALALPPTPADLAVHGEVEPVGADVARARALLARVAR
jgi:hypothetical protein